MKKRLKRRLIEIYRAFGEILYIRYDNAIIYGARTAGDVSAPGGCVMEIESTRPKGRSQQRQWLQREWDANTADPTPHHHNAPAHRA